MKRTTNPINLLISHLQTLQNQLKQSTEDEVLSEWQTLNTRSKITETLKQNGLEDLNPEILDELITLLKEGESTILGYTEPTFEAQITKILTLKQQTQGAIEHIQPAYYAKGTIQEDTEEKRLNMTAFFDKNGTFHVYMRPQKATWDQKPSGRDKKTNTNGILLSLQLPENKLDLAPAVTQKPHDIDDFTPDIWEGFANNADYNVLIMNSTRPAEEAGKPIKRDKTVLNFSYKKGEEIYSIKDMYGKSAAQLNNINKHFFRIAQDLFQQLQKRHEKGLTHCDVKASNVLYDCEKEVTTLIDIPQSPPAKSTLFNINGRGEIQSIFPESQNKSSSPVQEDQSPPLFQDYTPGNTTPFLRPDVNSYAIYAEEMDTFGYLTTLRTLYSGLQKLVSFYVRDPMDNTISAWLDKQITDFKEEMVKRAKQISQNPKQPLTFEPITLASIFHNLQTDENVQNLATQAATKPSPISKKFGIDSAALITELQEEQKNQQKRKENPVIYLYDDPNYPIHYEDAFIFKQLMEECISVYKPYDSLSNFIRALREKNDWTYLHYLLTTPYLDRETIMRIEKEERKKTHLEEHEKGHKEDQTTLEAIQQLDFATLIKETKESLKGSLDYYSKYHPSLIKPEDNYPLYPINSGHPEAKIIVSFANLCSLQKKMDDDLEKAITSFEKSSVQEKTTLYNTLTGTPPLALHYLQKWQTLPYHLPESLDTVQEMNRLEEEIIKTPENFGITLSSQHSLHPGCQVERYKKIERISPACPKEKKLSGTIPNTLDPRRTKSDPPLSSQTPPHILDLNTYKRDLNKRNLN